MTLNEAILKSLEELNMLCISKQVCQHIILNNYYEFGKAKTPCSTVSALLGNFVRAGKNNVKRKSINNKYHYFLSTSSSLDNSLKINKIRKNTSVWRADNFQLLENTLELIDGATSFKEGKSRYRKHLIRERNSKVISQAKLRFKQKHGKLFCEICKFDFNKAYPGVGVDYIEGHHNTPVSQLNENSETKIEDISMVCSNCHKMLHRRKNWLTVEELKILFQK